VCPRPRAAGSVAARHAGEEALDPCPQLLGEVGPEQGLHVPVEILPAADHRLRTGVLLRVRKGIGVHGEGVPRGGAPPAVEIADGALRVGGETVLAEEGVIPAVLEEIGAPRAERVEVLPGFAAEGYRPLVGEGLPEVERSHGPASSPRKEVVPFSRPEVIDIGVRHPRETRGLREAVRVSLDLEDDEPHGRVRSRGHPTEEDGREPARVVQADERIIRTRAEEKCETRPGSCGTEGRQFIARSSGFAHPCFLSSKPTQGRVRRY
jgi:hypothetical protein